MTSSAAHVRRPLPPRPHALDPDVLLTVVEPGWDQARSAWNLSVGQQPAAIGIPRTTDEVLALVRFAAERGLRVAPQATGPVSAVYAGAMFWTLQRAFANLAERPGLATELFGEHAHARLPRVKRAYDPSDVIRANHPVAPAATWR